MKQQAAAWHAGGKRVALVPTMGALHAGQEALIKAAAEQADVVAVSSVINPLRFAPNEIVSEYPRRPEEDQTLCDRAGATVLFTPSHEEIYPKGYSTYVDEDRISKSLCGISRPNHFRGVATLMAKLLNIVQPQVMVFGQKTAQRVAVVRKMIADLEYDVELLVVPTVREEDGLACDTNTRDFTPKQSEEALSVSRALKKVEDMVANGVRNPDRLVAEVTHILGDFRQVRVIYVSLVNRETMEPVREVEVGKCLLAISVWINEVRMIDNTLL
jgi:pantoate--beta-alanine ligase